ncbi:MAG: tagaturonate reductase [Cyclobacteriaceae bacterium]|nr:tagaturonate reductase [Cyclobacteriaceae bacterium]
MSELSRKLVGLEKKQPIKVVQFGEGNFLRAFVDFAIQQLNKAAGFNAGVAVVQPIEHGMVDMLNKQDGLYNLFLKGFSKGKEIQEAELVSSIVKGINPYSDFDAYLELAREEELQFIISNTTEAGIAYEAADTPEMKPPGSFPAKLTLLLYERFQFFKGDKQKGLTIIPCELINYNADTLRDIMVQYIEEWKLGDGFKEWLLNNSTFHNTLVDRIVPGYPREDIDAYNQQLPYKDNLIVTAESFFLWVIEGDEALKQKLPFHKTSLDVKIVKDMQPYRTRKVRILNGAHTSMVPISILYGTTTVKESVDDEFIGTFINKAVFDEIIPTLDMDKDELVNFAEEVFDRFRNPFIKHQLASIALNSISKFKVRVLPSLLEYQSNHNKIPTNLTFAFACLIRFYKGNWKGQPLPVNDSEEVVNELSNVWEMDSYDKISTAVLKNKSFWDQDLTQIANLPEAISYALQQIDENGIQLAFDNFTKKY